VPPRPSAGHGLKNWRVRTRLLLLIAIPTLTAVVLGGLRVSSSVQTAQTYQRTLQLADLNLDITTLVQRLQDERDQSIVYIARNAHGQGGGAVGQQVLFKTRHATEVAAAEVSQHLEQFGGLLSQADRQEASAALGDLANLPGLRLDAMQSTLPAPILQKYSRIITDMLVLEQNTGQGVGDVTLAETVRVLGLVSRMKEDASQQRAILTAALVQHTLDPGSRTALLTAQSDQAANQVAFSLSSTNAQRQQFQDSMRGSLVPLANSQIAGALALGTSLRSDQTTPDEFYGAMTNQINTQLGTVERSLVNSITNRTVQLRNAAFVSALVVALAVLLLLALSLLFTVMVARSMVRPPPAQRAYRRPGHHHGEQQGERVRRRLGPAGCRAHRRRFH